MNWDEELRPGWRAWEQWLAEWHARRSGDMIPARSGHLPGDDPAMTHNELDQTGTDWSWPVPTISQSARQRRFEEVAAREGSGALYYEEPLDHKVDQLDAYTCDWADRQQANARSAAERQLNLERTRDFPAVRAGW